METILVPTDFSENAWVATEYAAALAKQSEARLILFHAIDPMPATPDIPFPSLEKMLHYRIRRIEEISAQLVHKYGIAVSYIVRTSEITEILPTVYAEQQADLVVMGLRGNNPVGRLLMGHVTALVLSEGQLPVIVIPRDFTFRPIRHIFFPCDFEPLHSSKALQPVAAIARSFGASVELMHLPQSVGVAAPQHAYAQESSEDWESQLSGVEVIYSTMHQENTRISIDLGACESQADLLVLIPRRHAFFNEILQKSNNQKMVFHTRIPLMALPDYSF